MASTAWSTSEWDCFSGLGKVKAQAAFESHWSSWIPEADFTTMASYGLNTVRIPLGYWIVEELIGDDMFPTGGFKYLKQVVGWAKAAGLYVILDLHGAPMAQDAEQPSTGQYAPTAAFYSDSNYARAYIWLKNLWALMLPEPVFAIEAVNEPGAQTSDDWDMVSTYYPGAQQAVECSDTSFSCLAIQYMDILWMDNSADPTASLNKTDKHVMFDDHNYIKYTSTAATREAYMKYTCTDSRKSSNAPVIVGEFSLSPANETGSEFATSASDAASWYLEWSQAQMVMYEAQTAGWAFWSWKTDLGDQREV
ncbi:hypothetical protein RQP46_005883 [Phenoliferia psychrophenolica]